MYYVLYVALKFAFRRRLDIDDSRKQKRCSPGDVICMAI